MANALFLSRRDLRGLAEPAEFVDAVREAYRQRGYGAAAEPRTKLLNDDPAGMLTGYLAILPDTGAMGGYMYSGGFTSRDAWFFTPLFDAETGEPLALLDGVNMNPFKTGAAGATAVDVLAREDTRKLGLIGSGPQAAGQLQATLAVRSFETVQVYSPTQSHREEFAREFNGKLKPKVEAVDSSSDAVHDADVVITATTSSTPVVDSADLSEGTHVTAMGQYDPGNRELDSETIRRSKYVLDLTARAYRDAGAFLHAREEGLVDDEHVHAELGEIVAGKRPGRETRDELTVFDSGGTGIETVAGAYLLYEKARSKGIGTPIEFAPADEALTGRPDSF